MTILIAGLALFFVTHSVGIAAPEWRARRVERMGEQRFKLVYSLVSLVPLALIVWGYGDARSNTTFLYAPSPAMRHVTALLSVAGFVLIAAAYVPGTRMKAALGHPMTAGIALWALGHLLANGRLPAVILFGTFLLWSIVTFAVRRGRDRVADVRYPDGSLGRDAIAVVAGIALSLVFALFLHYPLIGVRPFALV
jgi:uncharacterized membrane protein